jgi:hypothetical protein
MRDRIDWDAERKTWRTPLLDYCRLAIALLRPQPELPAARCPQCGIYDEPCQKCGNL